MSRRTFTLLLIALVAAAGCRDERSPAPPVVPPPAPTASPPGARGPSPELTAEQVVRIVTEAMGRNDKPIADAGIATAFAFASPGNKAATGPLSRFTPMVKNELYRPLLNYATIDYAPARVVGDRAEQLVIVTDAAGEPAQFLFMLSRQAQGEFADCWMTDGVTRLGVEPLPPDPAKRNAADPAELRA